MWDKDIARNALALVSLCACCTVFTCALLVYSIRRSPERIRRKLFARQLTTLAVYDIILALMSLYWVLCNGGFILYSHRIGTIVSRIAQGVWGFSECGSMLLELHIALGMAFSWARCERGLQTLEKSLGYWVTLLCIGLTVLVVTLEPTNYYRKGNKSVTCGPPEYIKIVLLSLALVGCFAAYCSAMFRLKTRGTYAASREVERRFYLYPANFWLTYSWHIAGIVHPSLYGTYVGVFANAGLAANGFVNAVTYYFQSRLAKRSKLRSCTMPVEANPRLANIASFHAIFDYSVTYHDTFIPESTDDLFLSASTGGGASL